jgi:hypothetical protein
MHFFTGAHGDYHKPTDTWEKLDYVASARVLILPKALSVILLLFSRNTALLK